jgi:hypothetical protein
MVAKVEGSLGSKTQRMDTNKSIVLLPRKTIAKNAQRAHKQLPVLKFCWQSARVDPLHDPRLFFVLLTA